jgi:glycosyltransferase involved in cell wall biosynthesis
MKSILWQTRSKVVFDSFNKGNLMPEANGGNAYDFYAANSLKEKFKIRMDDLSLMKSAENLSEYLLRMKSYKPIADVIIKEPYPMVFGRSPINSKEVAMIHHIDEDFFSKDFRHRLFFRSMKRKLQKMDLVITVSKYWENYLFALGCKKVKVIYNSFNLKDYHSNESDIFNFKKKYQINNISSLIYIGNAHRPKGVYEVYDALKNFSYQLVMTGSKNNAPDLPVKFLILDRKEYLCLLHASDLVITFSKIPEGWNRIAHEALLSHTPVIGSGKGGMKELLEGAEQLIVPDIANLPEAVEEVLKNKFKYSENGLKYVQRFNMEHFKNEWEKTIFDLINEV